MRNSHDPEGKVSGRAITTEGSEAVAETASSRKSALSDWWSGDRPGGQNDLVPGSSGAPYTGRSSWLNRLGLRQGYETTTTIDPGGSVFGRAETAAHEGFHDAVAKYLPSFRDAGDFAPGGIPVGAGAKFLDETGAYAFGRLAVGRVHLLPAAPFEAFMGLEPAERAVVVAEAAVATALGYGAYRLTKE